MLRLSASSIPHTIGARIILAPIGVSKEETKMDIIYSLAGILLAIYVVYLILDLSR
jgi:small neutral amino acid transporter SnatA (MarC family)